MLGASLDPVTFAIVVIGALVAGFTSGFAGFGTALVSSGLWYHALPASVVPPLITLASVVAQIVGLLTVRKAFNWSSVAPYLGGGVVGVPLGVAALAMASPLILKTSAGVFLLSYSAYQLLKRRRRGIGSWGGKIADGLIGLGGGFLGGFAGLSGPLPLVWLQLRGGESDAQRAVYQPFNFVVLALAGIGMAVSGQMTPSVLLVAAYCLPATLFGAWLGARVYVGVSAQTFQRVVLGLLLTSGLILIVQTLAA
jgi:uncharacterized protein